MRERERERERETETERERESERERRVTTLSWCSAKLFISSRMQHLFIHSTTWAMGTALLSVIGGLREVLLVAVKQVGWLTQ